MRIGTWLRLRGCDVSPRGLQLRFDSPCLPQNSVMVSITPGQFKDQVQKTLNHGDCKDFIAKLISKAAELSEGKNDALSTDVTKLFDMINSQTNGGGFRLNASFKDIPSYFPPVSGG